MTNCRKKPNEELRANFSRFCSLAAIYIENCNTTPSSQTGQLLAIHLLNNSTLDEYTLNSSQIQLLYMEKALVSSILTNPVVSVRTKKLEELKILIANKPEEPEP